MTILDRPVRLHPNREVITDPRNFPALWTPSQRYIWDKATFTVPAETSEERVQFAADKYKRRFGAALEADGFEVLDMEEPRVNHSVVARGTTDPDRRPYVIWAKIRRRPRDLRLDVPDEDVQIYKDAGFELKS